MRTFRIAVILLPLIPLSGIGQRDPQTTINGIVAREDGKAVPSAFILVRDYQRMDQDCVADKWETRTAVDGSVSLVMEQGCYDIFVSANAELLPFANRICFKVQRSPVLKIKLKTDLRPRMLLRR
jgi:hypothetical protein